MNIQHKTFHGKADTQHIRDLLSQNYAVTGHPYFSVDPPNWERLNASVKLNMSNQAIHLWERPLPKQTQTVGLILYQPHQATFSSLTHPQWRHIETMLVDWVESEHLVAGIEQPLKCSVCERNEVQKAILAQRGYVKGELSTLFRRKLLGETIPKSVLPSGYCIHEVRNLSTDLLIERTAVENKVFDSKITLELAQALQKTPLYQSHLDLVITSPSSHVAAFCTVWFDAYHRVGYVEPIGTVADHRRLGLGSALLVEGLRRLQKMEAEIAYLGHSAENEAGNRLYESVGMRVFDQESWWEKESL